MVVRTAHTLVVMTVAIAGASTAQEYETPPHGGRQMFVDLPFSDSAHWMRVENAFGGQNSGQGSCTTFPQSLSQLERAIASYNPQLKSVMGLMMALAGKGGGRKISEADFFGSILPSIAECALSLPRLCKSELPAGLPCLIADNFQDGVAVARQDLSRQLCRSLLANCFLCTFIGRADRSWSDMPLCNFNILLSNGNHTQEIAKLRMFLHYFQRTATEPPLGVVSFVRRSITAGLASWLDSKEPLQPVVVAPLGVGIEDPDYGGDCFHTDFANQYIGGGVLAGGCVQEEIRFAISPELTVSTIFCPVMEDTDSIQIFGSEQFCTPDGYGFNLRFGRDYKDSSRRKADGSLVTGICAIDALDGRYGAQTSGLFDEITQLHPQPMFRELRKAYAGFQLEDVDRPNFAALATGNWGCGVFGGFVELKFILQWLAASRAGLPVRYFPYDFDCEGRLRSFVQRLVDAELTVGQLWRVLLNVAAEAGHIRPDLPPSINNRCNPTWAALGLFWEYVAEAALVNQQSTGQTG